MTRAEQIASTAGLVSGELAAELSAEFALMVDQRCTRSRRVGPVHPSRGAVAPARS